jgi:hypothetical protein
VPGTQPGVSPGVTPPFAPGFQAGVAPEAMAEQELAWLKSQADMLSQQLEQIKTRISEVEKASE